VYARSSRSTSEKLSIRSEKMNTYQTVYSYMTQLTSILSQLNSVLYTQREINDIVDFFWKSLDETWLVQELWWLVRD